MISFCLILNVIDFYSEILSFIVVVNFAKVCSLCTIIVDFGISSSAKDISIIKKMIHALESPIIIVEFCINCPFNTQTLQTLLESRIEPIGLFLYTLPVQPISKTFSNETRCFQNDFVIGKPVRTAAQKLPCFGNDLKSLGSKV